MRQRHVQILPLIMRTGITILLLFFTVLRALACVCEERSITEKFVQSDFVAHAKIVKVYENQGEEPFYKADIFIYELFKGDKLKSIYIYGYTHDRIWSSCAIYIPEDTELIIYAEKESEEHYGMGMCSGLFYLNGSMTEKEQVKEERELQILDIIKKSNINYTDQNEYQERGELQTALERYAGIQLEKNFALFEITFRSDLSIKSVDVINGFNEKLDMELVEILKQVKWISFNNGIKVKVPDNTKFLLGIYFYPAEDSDKSFLSQYYL